MLSGDYEKKFLLSSGGVESVGYATSREGMSGTSRSLLFPDTVFFYYLPSWDGYFFKFPFPIPSDRNWICHSYFQS